MSPHVARTSLSGRLQVRAEVPRDLEFILSPEALRFLEGLISEFEPRRRQLLESRAERRRRFDSGELPSFQPDVGEVREREWLVAPIPPDLQDRRVEIAGPPDARTSIAALKSGATAFIADFEDSNSPTWSNVLRGQLNLRDSIAGTLCYRSNDGREFRLEKERPSVLMVRPRGWHLVEKHIEMDGRPAPAALVDFGLYLYHNARALLRKGRAPYFYLPKLESHLEARLWNDVFVRAQRNLGLPQGTIRATALVETVPAAFEMDEILFELREHAAGLGFGRWGYAFSIVGNFRRNPAFILGERERLATVADCMSACTRLMVRTCHRRGIHAVGQVAAQSPTRGDEDADDGAADDVAAEMEREVSDGLDGTWVSRPDLVPIARRTFDARMTTPNQIDILPDALKLTAANLLAVPRATITVEGVRRNVEIAVHYMASWLSGNGSVSICNRLEDAATAELARAQLWQWLHHDNALLSDGTPLTVERFARLFDHVVNQVKMRVGEPGFTTGRYALAARLVLDIALRPAFTDFMTVVGYDYLE